MTYPRRGFSGYAPIPRPDDFDEYWLSTLKALADVPFGIQEEQTDTGKDASTETVSAPLSVKVSRISFTSLGSKRCTGWFFNPRGLSRIRGALLFLPGYSASCGSDVIQSVLTQIAQTGFAVFGVDPRGQGASLDQCLPAPEGKIVTGAASPSTFIYRGIAADCVRATEILSILTHCDSIGVFGHSQGGGLAIVTASLAPNLVGAVGCMIPFLSHFAHVLSSPPNRGPYRQIIDFIANNRAASAIVNQCLGYIDALHHAPRVKAPTLVSVGLKDTTCPPETVYALFDRLECLRSLLVLPETGHEHSPEFYHHELAWFQRFLSQNLRPRETLDQLNFSYFSP